MAIALPAGLRARAAGIRDTWRRLKPWVRWIISAASGLAIGGLILLALSPEKSHDEVIASIGTPVSVRLPAPPAPAVLPVPPLPEPSGPYKIQLVPPEGGFADVPALTQLLETKIELKPAPFPNLIIARTDGMLPRIADDGTLPWRAYARPQAPVPANAVKVAIVVLEAGLSEQLTAAALDQLPGQVTFAYNAYAPDIADQINKARALGHEVLLDLPMEPETYPIDDPGPETLLTQISPRENLKQLRTFMGRAPGAFGITSSSGRQFVTESSALAPILQDLKRRGLAWVDLSLKPDSVTPAIAAQLQVPTATGQIVLDEILTNEAIQAQLGKAEQLFKANGQGIIVARLYPMSVKWLASFIRGSPSQNIAIVPVSALVAVPAEKAAPAPVAPPAAPIATTGHHD